MQSKIIGNLLPSLIKKHFPSSILSGHVKSIIAYGSGVFPQTTKITTTNNTIDMIILVENIQIFHKQLLSIKPTDYTGLGRYLGANYLQFLNRFLFPAHFNHISVQGTKIKYAVVSLSSFIDDLTTWKLLTFAGRMHKPVLFNILQTHQSPLLSEAVQTNYRMALNVSILKMIRKVKDNQFVPIQWLYRQICNISYAGDIRHSMGIENVNKVDNIVKNNIQAFTQIYEPIIRNLSSKLAPNTILIEPTDKGSHLIKIHYTPQLVQRIVQSEHKNLPSILHEHLESVYNDGNNKNYRDLTEKILINGLSFSANQIETKLGSINKKSSIKMAMENFLSASLLDNAKYILAKIKKRGVK